MVCSIFDVIISYDACTLFAAAAYSVIVQPSVQSIGQFLFFFGFRARARIKSCLEYIVIVKDC